MTLWLVHFSHHPCRCLSKHTRRHSVRVVVWTLFEGTKGKQMRFRWKTLSGYHSIWDWVVQTAATGGTACSLGWKERARENAKEGSSWVVWKILVCHIARLTLLPVCCTERQWERWTTFHGNVCFDELTQKDGQHLRVRHMFLTLVCACEPSPGLRQY